jgi:TetR/AcrR family transcriptional repressor of nem operon
MRYPAEHKQETRERIVAAASRRFRRAGAGVGIGQLMRALKMTHGGFYRHFDSKHQLLAEALTRAFEDSRTRIRAAVVKAPPGAELAAIVNMYLSEEHCANISGGCPVAALASELSRQPRVVRQAMDRAVNSASTAMGQFMSGATTAERTRKAGVLFSAMSGTLAVARALSDGEMRRALLASARTMYIEAFGKG